jgi:putative hydrolase of the HAD superfamily
MITTVVFDMDGVLCRTRHRVRLDLLSTWCGHSADAIQAAIFESSFEREAECGRLSADEYLRGYIDRLGYAFTAEQWVQARRAAMEPDAEVLAIAKSLGSDHEIGMFTNNPFLLQRHFAEIFPVAAELFGTRAMFSAQIGHRKPTPDAFHHLALRLGAAPDEILYFDDDASYIDGAREAGLNAVVVGSGAADVRAGLAAHGVQVHAR